MYVAGIDAHATYLVVAIVSKVGELVQKPVRIWNRDAARLHQVLAPFRPLEAVVETSPAWPWLCDRLAGTGCAFVLAHATKLRAIAEANYKRDELDAELLARMRLAGLIPAVHVKDAATREQVVLLRHRARLVRLRTGAASRIHAELHRAGLYLERGRLRTRAGWRWVREAAWPHLGLEQRSVVRTYRVLMGGLTHRIRALDKRIARWGAALPAVSLLRTIPGIGPYRGLLIATEVLPITRFRRPEHLVSYAGLAPTSRQSGLRGIRHGGIPAGANRWLRDAFVTAVVSHVRQAPASWLTRYYRRHQERLGWPVARVAAARKLARATHAMLRTGAVWWDGTGERSELLAGHVASTTPSAD